MIVTRLRHEMLEIGIFGDRMAISEIILFSIFLADILLLCLITETSLSAALLVNSTFVLFFVTALGFLQGVLHLPRRIGKRPINPVFLPRLLAA